MSQTDKIVFWKNTVIRDLDSDRLVNIPGEIATVDIFADFASQLVLVQKFAHGLLETRPNHATRARNCKERGGYGNFYILSQNSWLLSQDYLC